MGPARRSVIFGIIAQCFSCAPPSFVKAESDQFPGDKKSMDQWMQTWMTKSKAPVGTLQLSRFADPMYFLTRPIIWNPNADQKLPPVKVPTGFVTDFASIPRIFWSLLRPDGLYTYPAIVHDYLYWTQTGGRDTADLTLAAGMEDFGVDAVTRTTIYEAVHLFGNSAWQENAQLKALGEQRILTNVPDDPTVTWEQWKKDQAHFQ